MKPPVKHYGLWLEWQRMLLNHEVLEHKVIHHLLSTHSSFENMCLTLRCSDSILFARGFSSIWKIRAVFDSSLLSSCLSFWFLFTENEYVGLILSSIYVPPVMLLFLLDQGLWGPYLFHIFSIWQQHELTFFSLQMESSGFLVVWWVSEGKEGGSSKLRPCLCLSACVPPGQ